MGDGGDSQHELAGAYRANGQAKEVTPAMLKTLLFQLSLQLELESTASGRRACQNDVVPTNSLLNYLRQAIRMFQDTYLLI